MLCGSSRGQDTIRVFFETGKDEVNGTQKMRLASLRFQYDFSTLDSIRITGMADSVGNMQKNLKLSLRRAKNVWRFMKDDLPKSTRVSVYAEGEKISPGDKQQSRRVDMAFYSRASVTEESSANEPEIKKDSLKKCFQVAYRLLHRSSRRIITRGRRKFVEIQYERKQWEKMEEYYYASEVNGRWTIRKVKWISRATGRDWWTEQRETTLIPFNDYKKFRVFTLSDNCEDCSGIFPSDQPLNDETTCMQTDRFLMSNIQLKRSLFLKKLILILAPREFIDPEASYYAGCNLYPFNWFVKGGRKKKNYYYAKIPHGGNYLHNIIKEMECCKFKPEDSECKRPLIIFIDYAASPLPLSIGVEAGYNQFLQTNLFYAAATLHKYGRSWQSALLLGADQMKEFYGLLRLQRNIITIPSSFLNFSESWQSPGAYSEPDNFFRLYIGSELIQRWGQSAQQLLQNAHAGISFYNDNERSIFRRVFVQAGYAHCWSDGSLPSFFFSAQAGIHIQLFHIEAPPPVIVDVPY
jgi:hypothetical protein